MARRSWGVRLISGSLLPAGAGTERGRRRECRRPLVTAGSGSDLPRAFGVVRAAVRDGGMCVTSAAVSGSGICVTPVVIGAGIRVTAVVLTRGVLVARDRSCVRAVVGDRFGWAVAGIGDAVGDGLLDTGELVADAGQEGEVAAGVGAGAGAVK